MQEQQPSRWTGALSWATAKAKNAVSDVFTAGNVLVATFATQITTAVSDYCFQVPGDANDLYWLMCVNHKQTVDLSRDLATQLNTTAVNTHECYDRPFPVDNWKAYGTTYFGADACDLTYLTTLDPRVNSIMTNNTKSGIYGGAADGWMTFAIITVGGGLLAISGLCAFLLYKKRCGKNAQTVNENTSLVDGHTSDATSADFEPQVKHY